MLGFKNASLSHLKSRLQDKGIKNPASMARGCLKEITGEMLDQISGGFGQVIDFKSSHTQGGVFSQSHYQTTGG